MKRNSACLPKQKVGFLKTQKCASSSIQNILLRFVIKNNLNVVLPAKDNILGRTWHMARCNKDDVGCLTKIQFTEGNYLGDHFNRKMMENTPWEYAGLEYDIFLCHTRWNHTSISEVLNDHNNNGQVFYFSILRDPVELFRSYFDFYKLGVTFLGEINGTKKWSRTTLEEYTRTVIYNEVKFKNKTGSSHGYNQMLTDFGLDFKDLFKKGIDNRNIEDKENVKMKVEQIDKQFDLIVMADEKYFEDSIILLKNALCWQYGDVVSLKLNSQSSEPRSKLSSRSRTIIKGSQFRYIFLKHLKM